MAAAPPGARAYLVSGRITFRVAFRRLVVRLAQADCGVGRRQADLGVARRDRPYEPLIRVGRLAALAMLRTLSSTALGTPSSLRYMMAIGSRALADDRVVARALRLEIRPARIWPSMTKASAGRFEWKLSSGPAAEPLKPMPAARLFLAAADRGRTGGGGDGLAIEVGDALMPEPSCGDAHLLDVERRRERHVLLPRRCWW